MVVALVGLLGTTSAFQAGMPVASRAVRRPTRLQAGRSPRKTKVDEAQLAAEAEEKERRAFLGKLPFAVVFGLFAVSEVETVLNAQYNFWPELKEGGCDGVTDRQCGWFF